MRKIRTAVARSVAFNVPLVNPGAGFDEPCNTPRDVSKIVACCDMQRWHAAPHWITRRVHIDPRCNERIQIVQGADAGHAREHIWRMHEETIKKYLGAGSRRGKSNTSLFHARDY